MVQKIFLSFFLLAVAACTPPPFVQEIPSPMPERPVRFGAWLVDKKNCELATGSAGVELRTDGHLSNNQIYLNITTNRPQNIQPVVRLTVLPETFLPVEGRGQSFSTELPYYPLVVAHYQNPNSVILITLDGMEAAILFSTAPLVEGLSKLNTYC